MLPPQACLIGPPDPPVEARRLPRLPGDPPPWLKHERNATVLMTARPNHIEILANDKMAIPRRVFPWAGRSGLNFYQRVGPLAVYL